MAPPSGVASAALRDAGYEVAEVAGADEALALLADGGCFEVLVVDADLPGIGGEAGGGAGARDGGGAGGGDGAQAGVVGRARAGRAELGVLYMTGRQRELGGGAKLGGRDGLIRKPFGTAEVLAAVRRLGAVGDVGVAAGR